MGLAVSITAALVVWLVLWAIGVKAIDGFILAILISLIAVAASMLGRFKPGQG
jgi:hypothetical protein